MGKFVKNISESLYRISPRLHFQIYKLWRFYFNQQVPAVQFLAKHIKEGDCVLDIGSNIGMYSYAMSRAVGQEGKVFAFEANPNIAKEFRQNITSKNVELNEMAVTNSLGKQSFYVHLEKYAPSSSLEIIPVLHNEKLVKEITVNCTSIDSFCRNRNLAPNFIKIDVEGHEFEVFQGGVDTIECYRPIILFELVDAWLEEKKLHRIIKFLEPAYTLQRVEDGADAAAIYQNFAMPEYLDIRDSPVFNIACFPKPLNHGSKPILNASALENL